MIPSIEHGVTEIDSFPVDNFAIDDAADWTEVDVGVKPSVQVVSFVVYIPICQEFLEVVDDIEIFDDEDGAILRLIVNGVYATECVIPNGGDGHWNCQRGYARATAECVIPYGSD